MKDFALPPKYRQYFRIIPQPDGSFMIRSRTNTPHEAYVALEERIKALYPDYQVEYKTL